MAYEPKPGSFSLFKNDKEGNEMRPDYTGNGLDLEGNPVRVSAWIKEGAKGKFMSCKMEVPRSVPEKKQSKPATQGFIAAIDEDDLPFK